MRNYAKVSPRKYTGAWGKALRGDPVAQLVYGYLMDNTHSNMIGLYHLPMAYITADLGISVEAAKGAIDRLSKPLRRASEVAWKGCFCRYDETLEMVWVVESARHEIGEELKARDNRIGAIAALIATSSNSFLIREFRQRYAAWFDDSGGPLPSPSGDPLEGLLARDQEQEQYQEQDQEEKSTRLTARPRASGKTTKAKPSKAATGRQPMPLPADLAAVPIPSGSLSPLPAAMRDRIANLGDLWRERLLALPKRKWPATELAEHAQIQVLASLKERHGDAYAVRAVLLAITKAWTGFDADWVENSLRNGNSGAPRSRVTVEADDEDRERRARRIKAHG